jgi:hypothetical protein
VNELVSIRTLPEAPQGDYDLDLRTLRSELAVDEDGDPVLVLRDDDTVIVVELGLGAHAMQAAIEAAHKLSDTAERYATVLHEVRAVRRASSRVSER